MSQPSLLLQNNDETTKASVNLLPCHLQRDGAVNPVQPYWRPVELDESCKIAYFRGRKLHGKTVKLPEQYRGLVLEKDTTATPDSSKEESTAQQQTLRNTGQFAELTIWDHEKAADASTDPYLRGLEEWLVASEKINSYEATAD